MTTEPQRPEEKPSKRLSGLTNLRVEQDDVYIVGKSGAILHLSSDAMWVGHRRQTEMHPIASDISLDLHDVVVQENGSLLLAAGEPYDENADQEGGLLRLKRDGTHEVRLSLEGYNKTNSTSRRLLRTEDELWIFGDKASWWVLEGDDAVTHVNPRAISGEVTDAAFVNNSVFVTTTRIFSSDRDTPYFQGEFAYGEEPAWEVEGVVYYTILRRR